MIIQPIIPIWMAAVFCVCLFLIRIKEKAGRFIQLLICFLLFAINLRPMILAGKVETRECNLDVVIVIDNTISMHANDYQNGAERVQGVQDACEEITDRLPGARFAVISFHNSSQIMAPFTTDVDMIRTCTRTLPRLDRYYAYGSSLNTPMEDMKRLLELSRNEEEKRQTVVFFLSDGEITNGDELESYRALSKYTDAGIVLGIGTTKGSTMSYPDDFLGLYTNYIRDPVTGEKAVSKLDESNLRQIAKDLSIYYMHYTGSGDIDEELAEINTMSETATIQSTDGAQDLFYYFAMPLIALCLIDWFISEKKKGRL